MGFTYNVTTAPTDSVCATTIGNAGTGLGNVDSAPVPIGYALVDKSDAVNIVDYVTVLSGLGSNVGSFSINPLLYSNYGDVYLGFKFGNTWSIYDLALGATSGTWLVTPQQAAGLSHISVFAGSTSSSSGSVPLPGSLLLIGVGLLGLARVAKHK
jgi:PEP-CTERM motif